MRRGPVSRSTAGVAAAVVLTGAVAACATTAEAHRFEPGSGGSGWYRLPDFPLEPRQGPVLAWTGGEVLIVGGSDGPPCPPAADCAAGEGRSDGAAFDPATATWRELADAPVDLQFAPHAFAAGQLFVSSMEANATVLVSYDVDLDAWRTWDAPTDASHSLVADGDRVVFVSGSDESGVHPDYVLDVATETWSILPEDPIGPAFDRVITSTPSGLVLTAKELVASPGSEKPSLVLAALYNRDTGRWESLPDTGQIGGWLWASNGDRMIAPELGGADGGNIGNWGRIFPFGGVLNLPDGTWSPLADPPQEQAADWIPATAGARYSVSSGYVYDDARQTWSRLDRPTDGPDAFDSAVWAGDRLFVLGGIDRRQDTAVQSEGAWLYIPEG